MLSKTYKLVKSPEPAMTWDCYSNIVRNEYTRLLELKGTTEKDFQDLFEQHPCLLPDAYATFGGGAHGPYPGAVISQPILPDMTQKRPDFLYIARDSATVYAILIEIESPHKRWATKSGQPSADFTQATTQIADWKSWFQNPLNTARFYELYQIPQDWVRFRNFEQRYILIFGRRGDPTLTPQFNAKRSTLQRVNESYMTFDRLRPNGNMQHCLCANIDSRGYKAISVPATLQLGPNCEYGFKEIHGKREAIISNSLISPIRKEFLISRVTYWDNWNGGGLRSSNDFE